ncbi:SLBB domain-containing protein [Congregibacter litoralis]|uniref:Periplasmic protein involved in polysaccharide export n=1 Tax=Congregibacter litoralis KT71 TaxID=314285 RepID=A4AB88_9GAMM|nr:SLBB domain-containing protein [Congregibacter litoralis]EAQ96642.2 Periplasmic protein involved in polysaccharide export [Congregibacter litoralis KT71]
MISRTAPRTLRPTLHGLLSLILPMVIGYGAPSSAQDDYLPFVEPLQVTQKRAYYNAAPAGQDEPLSVPSSPITVPVEVVIDEESRLEALAREKQQALSLDESAQDQALSDELEQFGYSIFNRSPSTFAPVEGIPVPSDYRIGPGDNIVIQLFGKRNVQYNLVVTREGKILIPEFGPVTVGGMNFDDAETLITTGFEQRMIGARAVVTMGKLRTIQVRLAGDVKQPGIYTIGGLSSLIDALLTTGGVAETGTLRDIQLIRGGKIVTRLDLYELLLAGKSDSDAFLRHNDTIFVPAIGEIVYLGGEVQRPAIYELQGESTLGDVLDMAGGMLPTASLEESLIERIQQGGSRTVIDFQSPGTGKNRSAILATPMRSGDVVRILPLEDRLDAVVLLDGQVERPGAYQFEAGMRVSSLLRDTRALLPGVDMNFALIEREDRQSLQSSVIYISPKASLQSPGSDSDYLLQARDRIRLFRVNENREDALAALRDKIVRQSTDPRAANLLELRGAIRHRGQFPLDENARLLDALKIGGGLQSGGDYNHGVIARTALPSLELKTLPFSIAAAQRNPGSEDNPRLKAGDRIYFLGEDSARSQLLGEVTQRLKEQARYGDVERVVSILGEVLSPGEYPLVENMRASDLLCTARGLSRRADGLSMQLSRRNIADDSLQHESLDTRELVALCADLHRAQRGALSTMEERAFRGRYNNETINPALQPRDQLAVSLRTGWSETASITLRGEIVKPGVYAIGPDETLCEVLQRAGGLTESAYAFGAEFTRQSVRDIQQATLDELHEQLDDLMVELSLSHSFRNDEKSSHEWGGKQDTLRVIQQLERAEATGRMVVNLDRVQRCRSRDALALENGDELMVPRMPNHVQVSGQVYVATSHLYDEDRSIKDYVELSGGSTVLGRLDHTYVVQANGEVLNLKGKRSSRKIARQNVMPGARIYVPINVDRMNPTEKAQSWVSTLAQAAILAGIVL